MSDCPNCGAKRDPDSWKSRGQLDYLCGMSVDTPRSRTNRCQIGQLQRDLRQANAVVDAIETLTENGESTLEIESYPSGKAHVVVYDRRLPDNDDDPYGNGNTLREALESCVEARDQHDKEAE